MGGDNGGYEGGGGYYSQQPAGAPTYGESSSPYNTTMSSSSQYTYGGSGDGGGGPSGSGSAGGDGVAMLRRRNIEKNDDSSNNDCSNSSSSRRGSFENAFKKKAVVKNLDFMFPKVDTEFTVQTERGGMAFCIAVFLIVVLCMAETVAWISSNQSTRQHVVVDTSLGQQMRVYLNITFPALACEDLHVDIMDVAGDSQLNVENTMTKTRLTLDGTRTGHKQKVESNAKRREQENANQIQKLELPADYCGPCYGAQVNDTSCCNTCDDLLEAYDKKNWKTEIILTSSEQCIREGRHKTQPKLMTKGQGCNLVGYFTLNRVAGNFHIAMGEGIERDGRHVHTFQPDDTPNFNASHIIHHLSFGSISSSQQEALLQEQETSNRGRKFGSGTVDAERAVLQASQEELDAVPQPLNGVRKIVEKQHGTTGLFQYFIKVVPTTVVTKTGQSSTGGGQMKNILEKKETNGYFFTERFRPLMLEYFNDDHFDFDDGDNSTTGDPEAVVPAGATGSSHSNHEHHDIKKNSILPGVFFIYEIYPFSVQITSVQVPLTHLLIRIMATIGGVLTIVKWADFTFFERCSSRRSPTNR